MSSALPPLSEIQSHEDALNTTLTTLFESSPTLHEHLVPQVFAQLSTTRISSYSELIDVSLHTISQWDDSLKAQFIAGHPRIGERKNLSQLSVKEQAAAATPPEVLARLEVLNQCYERRYPGLRYITFVNGRSRAMIMEEMEDVLGLEKEDRPEDDNATPMNPGGEAWTKELERAVRDMGRIAKDRLKAMGVE
ncbi:hypothetical protein EIP91_012210 [Steccherinum ochraceum]|uniref:Oxo-4-hydroxy-4-carboxy-5-ureidoimidazoline decarboxylase domain-containing protein n=1 Tax=Steccherinum ochraceum TaxID=92696 RepID=A0A4R0RGN5_9APHY|nr:hypothetical protein EIP91_012210 [Steccherinum ochraceum]